MERESSAAAIESSAPGGANHEHLSLFAAESAHNELTFIKEAYASDQEATARYGLFLHNTLRKEEETKSPEIGQTAHQAAIFDLAVADYKHQRGNDVDAEIFFKSGLDMMKKARVAGDNVDPIKVLAASMSHSFPNVKIE